jgi:hypothetical protein
MYLNLTAMKAETLHRGRRTSFEQNHQQEGVVL